PYRSSADAIATWPTTATAIGVRSGGAALEVFAPFRPPDLLRSVVRANPVPVTPQNYASQGERGPLRWPPLPVPPPAEGGGGRGGRERGAEGGGGDFVPERPAALRPGPAAWPCAPGRARRRAPPAPARRCTPRSRAESRSAWASTAPSRARSTSAAEQRCR